MDTNSNQADFRTLYVRIASISCAIVGIATTLAVTAHATPLIA